MSSSLSAPAQDEALLLYEQLCAGAASASADFAGAFTEAVALQLAAWNPDAPEDFVFAAAGDAVLGVIIRPALYNPARGPLFAYLCMSAQGDLRNALKRETRYRHEQIPPDDVADDSDAGNYLGQEDDPATPLLLAEDEALLEQCMADFTETDRQVVRLMLDGERRTAAFVPVLRLEDRPAEEQAREVKRAKDRVVKRLQRRCQENEQGS